MTDFVAELDRMIGERKKMTSELYQTILGGKATERLLQNFVLHRWPIKSFWTRNILGIASRIEDYRLRVLLVENIYEEETGALSNSGRHLDTFADFGAAVGLTASDLENPPVAPETAAVIEHNVRVCNGGTHFTEGVASVLLLMEGQPPIVGGDGKSMLSVMRDVYGLPEKGYEFFVHHASADEGEDAVSELEDEHAAAARELLHRYCDTPQLKENAIAALANALELRHRHFDMILSTSYDPAEPIFRYGQ
ncbi:TenA family transcriptional regulator [Actinokineospora xionganensis]|uniref:Iron-containing redox enzyme family protein n=1 Tax=Actinokineospora xionganensis TaxID=2684470 RepID=A0ABR7L0U8_9PSEU|nr:iron-containing redox enzyme family protein [Actinokineospora xionganensis]MBC6446103.1 iron-containing redox enzyme family protein [Actinokineospora xionganensis]